MHSGPGASEVCIRKHDHIWRYSQLSVQLSAKLSPDNRDGPVPTVVISEEQVPEDSLNFLLTAAQREFSSDSAANVVRAAPKRQQRVTLTTKMTL